MTGFPSLLRLRRSEGKTLKTCTSLRLLDVHRGLITLPVIGAAQGTHGIAAAPPS